MKIYKKQHELCPKCGYKGHSSTLMGYVLDMNKKEEYKNLNICVCLKCGNRHTYHERISRKNLLIEKFKKLKERIWK